MALGINLLFRMGRKLVAAPLEDSGLLPNRYYYSQALDALEGNDFPECLRYLRLAGADQRRKARLVSQLLILRCRMLQEQHKLHVQTLQEMLRINCGDGLDRRYQEILTEEQKAIGLLEGYVRDAQGLFALIPNSISVTPH
ncbi:hypothetical protein [Desulfobacca acetoxidans]|uniref:Uncharacterized protein n=1 Tax=Desulfobacca acetoxidans (strain ATCC 700848 / DSM 11109 / ASRB2) TaxID=880072 RepID=F2NG98_DESAR|nr:hypothetical protein [Desulfobacca acetoxidans]AEB08511.1 hypothetical protein Desac_0628 [Desulfobacca acetoxidans DSM 11109]